jgi:hypothetical protein
VNSSCELRVVGWTWAALLMALAGGCVSIESHVAVEAKKNEVQVGAKNIVATTQPTDAEWAEISRALGRTGVLHDGVYTITIPRDDFDVSIDGMGIPTAAGLESAFHFYRCPCGKMNVAGVFVLADYESNDVLDALRKGQVNVASIAPLLLYARPNLLALRFQAEGDGATMAKTLRDALRCTGKERMAPQKLDNQP